MTEELPPDPSNSPPEHWLGGDVDDTEQMYRLGTLTADELARGEDLDRVEGLS